MHTAHLLTLSSGIIGTFYENAIHSELDFLIYSLPREYYFLHDTRERLSH
jgi:hypothetical protein